MRIERNILSQVTDEDIKNGTFIIPNGVTKIDIGAFGHCTNLKFINIPNSVTVIGDWAFEYCINLQSINIPNSVTYIGSWAFECCTRLKSINIPDSVTYIGSCAFLSCTRLKSIHISDNVIHIGEYAFLGCTSLKSINIPAGVIFIGRSAFGSCTSLQFINIPHSVTVIGLRVFANCKKLIKKGKYKACKVIRSGDNITYSCCGTIFEIGKQMPVINDIEFCKRGYHYVENLYDIFNYYYGDLNEIALFEVEPGNVIEKDKNNSKCVTNTIKLIRQIPWSEAFENIK